MKMYIDHSQEVGEVGCREEVVQGTDTRGSVLYKALSRDVPSGSTDLRPKSFGHHNRANGVVRHGVHLHDDARLTDKPTLRALLSSNSELASITAPPCGAAIGRRADPVGGHRHRRTDGPSTSSASVSMLPGGAASGLCQKRRLVPLPQKNLPNGSSKGNYSLVTASMADSSSSSEGGPLVIMLPPAGKSNLLASPSRLRHRPKPMVTASVIQDGSWSAAGRVREIGAPASREFGSSFDSVSDEDCGPVLLHKQQHHHDYNDGSKPSVIFKSSRETLDVQPRVLVINGNETEAKGYILADSPPLPAVSPSLSIHPIYPYSPDCVEMGLDYVSCSENPGHPAEGRLLNHSEVSSARRFQRSISDESNYSSRSTVPSDNAVAYDRKIIYYPQTRVEELPAMECAPLDLSMGRRGKLVDGNIEFQSEDGYGASVALVVEEPERPCLANSNSPPNPLMQLADACSYVLENEAQSSLSGESSPPSSLSDSNSCHSVYKDEQLQVPSESTYFTSSQEYLTESQENSLNDCASLQVQELQDIKYEIGDEFQADGIILNSNVLGDKVFHDSRSFGLQQIEVRTEDNKGVLRDVANLTVEDGYTEGLYRTVYTTSGNVSSTPSIEDYHNYYGGSQDSSSGSECSFTARSNSSSRITIGGGMATSVTCTSGGSDNKKRLRLGKAEYESMSEQDRKIRHRVLDNQRSKQYRERRRKMITSLQSNISVEENRNRGLRDDVDRFERRLALVKEATRAREHCCDWASGAWCPPSRCLGNRPCAINRNAIELRTLCRLSTGLLAVGRTCRVTWTGLKSQYGTRDQNSFVSVLISLASDVS